VSQLPPSQSRAPRPPEWPAPARGSGELRHPTGAAATPHRPRPSRTPPSRGAVARGESRRARRSRREVLTCCRRCSRCSSRNGVIVASPFRELASDAESITATRLQQRALSGRQGGLRSEAVGPRGHAHLHGRCACVGEPARTLAAVGTPPGRERGGTGRTDLPPPRPGRAPYSMGR
jgi:hypothetical protein